jgi:hypothetical protein
MPERETESDNAGRTARAADCMVTVHTQTRGIHDHVRVWINGQHVGTLVVGLGHGRQLERLLLGTGPQVLGDGIGVSDEQLSEWRCMGTNWLDVARIDTLGVTGLVGRIVLRLLDAVETMKARARADREVILAARSIAGLWRVQDGFSADAIDGMCDKVEAHAAAEKERGRGQ